MELFCILHFQSDRVSYNSYFIHIDGSSGRLGATAATLEDGLHNCRYIMSNYVQSTINFSELVCRRVVRKATSVPASSSMQVGTVQYIIRVSGLFCSPVFSFLGAKVPGNESSRELSLPGNQCSRANVPRNFRCW